MCRLLGKTRNRLPYELYHSWLYTQRSLFYYRETGSSMFIATTFTKGNEKNHPRYVSTEEWIKNMCYTYMMEFYVATKKNVVIKWAIK